MVQQSQDPNNEEPRLGESLSSASFQSQLVVPDLLTEHFIKSYALRQSADLLTVGQSEANDRSGGVGWFCRQRLMAIFKKAGLDEWPYRKTGLFFSDERKKAHLVCCGASEPGAGTPFFVGLVASLGGGEFSLVYETFESPCAVAYPYLLDPRDRRYTFLSPAQKVLMSPEAFEEAIANFRCSIQDITGSRDAGADSRGTLSTLIELELAKLAWVDQTLRSIAKVTSSEVIELHRSDEWERMCLAARLRVSTEFTVSFDGSEERDCDARARQEREVLVKLAREKRGDVTVRLISDD